MKKILILNIIADVSKNRRDSIAFVAEIPKNFTNKISSEPEIIPALRNPFS